MYRILYNKIYGSEKDAYKDLKKVSALVTNPKVEKGSVKNAWLVVLYECKTKERLEEGITFYRNKGLTVFRTEI